MAPLKVDKERGILRLLYSYGLAQCQFGFQEDRKGCVKRPGLENLLKAMTTKSNS